MVKVKELEEKTEQKVEEESSSIFVIALGLFVLGTSGILATDDILACFVVGCALSWDDQ